MKQNAVMSTESNTKILNSKDLIAYFLVAGTGAVVQLISSSLIQDWFAISFEQSIPPAYLISLPISSQIPIFLRIGYPFHFRTKW